MFKKHSLIHYFAMEVNPDVFNGQREQALYIQLQDLIDKDDKFIGTDRNDDDQNNGVDRSWVKLLLRSEIKCKTSHYYSSYTKKANTFPRIYWANRKQTLKEIHIGIFKFLRPKIE